MDDELIPETEEGSSSFDDEVTQESEKANVVIENDALSEIVQLFRVESQIRLSSFLRKKIKIDFNAINSCLFEEIEHDYTKLLLLNFEIAPRDARGLIALDFILLDAAINLLYGGTVTANKMMRGLGKSGMKIASKIAEIILGVLQESVLQSLKINLKLSQISSQLTSVFQQEKGIQSYNISFRVTVDSNVCHINLIMPASVFENPEQEASSELAMQSLMKQESSNQRSIFDERGRHELIESSITVSVNLPPISLKLRDVVNLKAGDIIPINDPLLVYIVHNKKKIFRGSSGQSNQHKAVKIIDKM